MHSERRGVVLYESVANDLCAMIRSGVLRTGARAPSVRRMSRQRRVSIATVVHAYELLENRGFLEARPQSGYYVRPQPHSIDEPALSRPPPAPHFVGVQALVHGMLEDFRAADLVHLGAAVPHKDVVPITRLQRSVGEILRREPLCLASYSRPPGRGRLRREIALRARDWGVSLAAEDIITTNGGYEAINLCLRAVAKPGDIVALESPTYFGHLQMIESLGMKALEIPTHPRTGISLEALELAIEREPVRACIAMPSVSNPLGSTMPEAAKKRLVRMLARREIPLIENAVYNALHFDPAPPFAAKAFDGQGVVMLCSSFTKTIAPGFRIGWVAPGRYYAQVRMLKYISSVGVSDLLQLALAEFLKNGSYERMLRSLRRTHEHQVERFRDAVHRHFPQGTKVTRPSGGFVLWVEMPGSVDALELYRRALEDRIGIIPGPMFSASGRYSNCVRLSCGLPWSERVQAAVARVGELARELAS